MKLGGDAQPEFRIMKSDRIFEFTVEDLGWEWGAPTIAEADVRTYGKIGDDREIVVEVIGQDEIVVPHGGTVDLAGPKIERIYSRESHVPTKLHVIFVINGEPTPVAALSSPAEAAVSAQSSPAENAGTSSQPAQTPRIAARRRAGERPPVKRAAAPAHG